MERHTFQIILIIRTTIKESVAGGKKKKLARCQSLKHMSLSYGLKEKRRSTDFIEDFYIYPPEFY